MRRLYYSTNERKWKVISTEGNSDMNMRKLDMLISAMLLACQTAVCIVIMLKQ